MTKLLLSAEHCKLIVVVTVLGKLGYLVVTDFS